MKEKIKAVNETVVKTKAYKATNGKKTIVTAIAFVVVRLLGDKIPFIEQHQEFVEELIEYGFEIGLFHKFIKSIPAIYQYIKSKIEYLNQKIRDIRKKS